jgi:hypothetical protein
MNALSGSLVHFQPVQILRLLQMTSATGRLQVTRDAEQTDLFIEAGRRLFARTNGASVRTGDILVHRGDVRPEAIALAAALQADQPGQRLGEMLVEGGAVDGHTVDEAVLQVQRRIVCCALLWQHGEFSFFPGETPAERERIAIDLDLDRLIALAIRTADDFGSDPGQQHAA